MVVETFRWIFVGGLVQSVDAFNEKRCRDYLRLIEPSIENIDT